MGMATEGTGSNAARDLGLGWLESFGQNENQNHVYLSREISGPGSIQHIWMTPTGNWRIFYPAVIGMMRLNHLSKYRWGLFGMGLEPICTLASLPVVVNPNVHSTVISHAIQKNVKSQWKNIGEADMILYYQVDYVLTEVPADANTFIRSSQVNRLPWQ